MSFSADDSWLSHALSGLSEHERERSAGPGAAVERSSPEIAGYRIEGCLGEGATAVVYRAWDLKSGRPVAIKVLREGLGLRDEVRRRFQREARAAARVSQPNVVAVYDAGEHAGRPYLVMEIVDGCPLRTLLGEKPREVEQLLRLLEQAARGVSAAHETGIVHRDLKPANILVSRSGEAKVVDFGLAHLVDSGSELTRTGCLIGTPLYMAPEQVEARPDGISPATDVYALGAILYEILTGSPPHTGDSVLEIYRKISRADPAAPRNIDPNVSPELETIALKALEKDPRRRYPSAASFAEDLRRYLEGRPVSAKSVPRGIRLWRKAVRHRHIVFPTVAAMVMATALAAGWLSSVVSKRNRIKASLSVAARYEKDRQTQEAHYAFRSALDLDTGHLAAREGFQRTGRELRRRQEELIEKERLFEEVWTDHDLVKRRPARAGNAPEDKLTGDVILSEDFENYNRKGWNEYGGAAESIQIVDGGPVGRRCLQLTTRRGEDPKVYVYKMFDRGMDTCYVRFYVRFPDKERDAIHQGVRLLGQNPPLRWPEDEPALRRPPEGDKRFFAFLEPSTHRGRHSPPGVWRVMSDWCDVKPELDGTYGPAWFYTDIPVERDGWICVEVMLKCNSRPELDDGEQALWVNGKEAGRWGGFRWRTDPDLKVTGFQLLHQISERALVAEGLEDRSRRVCFDGIVVSRSYVGPHRP